MGNYVSIIRVDNPKRCFGTDFLYAVLLTLHRTNLARHFSGHHLMASFNLKPRLFLVYTVTTVIATSVHIPTSKTKYSLQSFKSKQV